MAKLQAVLASLDGLAEPLRELYFEQDGKFYLDADIENSDHPSVTRLKAAKAYEVQQRSAVSAEKAALAARIAELEKERNAAADSSRAGGADSKEVAQIRKVYDERIKAIETVQAEWQAKAKAAEDKLRDARISEELRRELEASGVAKEFVPTLLELPSLRKPLRLGEDDRIAVYDGDLARPDPENPGRPLGAKPYVQAFLKDNRQFMAQSSGGGVTGATGTQRAATGGVIQVSKAQMKDNGFYQRTQEQAAKTGATVQIVE